MPAEAHGGPSGWGASGASGGGGPVGGETEEELFWFAKDTEYFSRVHPQLLLLLQQHQQQAADFLRLTVPLLAARAQRAQPQQQQQQQQKQQQQQQQQQAAVQTASVVLSAEDIRAIEGEAPLPQAEDVEQQQLLLQLEKLQQQLQQEQQQQQQKQRQQQQRSGKSQEGSERPPTTSSPVSTASRSSSNSSSNSSSSSKGEAVLGGSGSEGAPGGAGAEAASRGAAAWCPELAEQQQQQQKQQEAAAAAEGNCESRCKGNEGLSKQRDCSSSSTSTPSTPTSGGSSTSTGNLASNDTSRSSKSSSSTGMCAESSVFSWLPVSRSASLLSLLHHQQLLAHAPYQTRDTGMAYRETDSSSLSLVDLVVKKRPAAAPRHQRRHGGGGRSCGSSSSSSGASTQRAANGSCTSSKSKDAGAVSAAAAGAAAEDEAADEPVFDPLVNKKWGGQPLPPVSLGPPPDGAVLSLLLPSGVSAGDFPAAFDDCTDVDDVLRLLAAVAAAQQQQQRANLTAAQAAESAAPAPAAAAATQANEAAAGVKAEGDPQEQPKAAAAATAASVATAEATGQRPLPLPQVLCGPTAVWLSRPSAAAGAAGGACESSAHAASPAAAGAAEAAAEAEAAAAETSSSGEPNSVFLPLYAQSYVAGLDSRSRAALCSRLPQQQQQLLLQGPTSSGSPEAAAAPAAAAADELLLPARPPHVLPPLLHYFSGVEERPQQQQQQEQQPLVSPVPPAAAQAAPEDAACRTGVPLALEFCRERGVLLPLEGLEGLQQEMQQIRAPAAAAPTNTEPSASAGPPPSSRADCQASQQQQPQQEEQEQQTQQEDPQQQQFGGVSDAALASSEAETAAEPEGGLLVSLWKSLAERKQPPLEPVSNQQQQDEEEQQQQQHEEGQQQQQAGAGELGSANGEGQVADAGYEQQQQRQQGHEQPQPQQEQKHQQQLCAVGGDGSLETEAENLAWRLVRLAREKQHLLGGLLTSVSSEKRPALQEWAKAEDKMVQHYIQQSAAHALDTRHTYTLADQSLDISRLRVSCSSSSRLPPEWAERALCTVCGSGEDWDEDPIIFCDGCYTPTHFLCLGGKAGGFDAAVAAVAAKRRRRAREAGGDDGLSPAAAAAVRAAAAAATTATAAPASGSSGGSRDAERAGGGPAGVGGARRSSSGSSSTGGAAAAGGEERRFVGGAGGFAAGQNEEEEWLCPICDHVRKQLPLVDEETALAAIRLAASPRTAAEAEACKAARHSDWGHEDLAAFDRWSPPKLLGLQQGDGRKPRGYNHRRAAITPQPTGAGIPAVRVDRAVAAVAAAAVNAEGGPSSPSAAAATAAATAAAAPAAGTKTAARDDAESRIGSSSSSSSAVNPLDYLRQVPFCFSDSEDEELVITDAAGATGGAQPQRGGSGTKALQQQQQQEEEPLQSSKFYCKDPKMRCVVEVSPVHGLLVTLRLPVCCLCGFDAFCPGGGPMRKTDKPKVWAHVRCALAVNGVVVEETIHVTVEENRSRLRCLLCHHWGPAPTQCAQQSCPRPFHLPCATANHALQTDWDQGRPVVFCHPHSKDRAPTLILRRYQANKEKEKVKARALDLPAETDLSKRRLSLCSADLLFASHKQTTAAIQDLLARHELPQQQLLPQRQQRQLQHEEEVAEEEGLKLKEDAAAGAAAAAGATAELKHGDSETDRNVPARSRKPAASGPPVGPSASDGEETADVQQQQQQKRPKNGRGKQQQQQQGRAGTRHSRGSAGGESRLSVSSVEGCCPSEGGTAEAAAAAAAAAEEEEATAVKEVGDAGEAARIAACLFAAAMPSFLCDEKTFCCLFSGLSASSKGQVGEAAAVPSTFAGMRAGQGLHARGCLLEGLALLLAALGVHSADDNREALQQLALAVRDLGLQDAAEAAAGAAGVSESPAAITVKPSSSSSTSSSKLAAAGSKHAACPPLQQRKALPAEEGRQGEMRTAVSARLAMLNKSPCCCLCGRSGLASQQHQQQHGDQQQQQQQHGGSEVLQRCTFCHVKVCRGCWGTVERQPAESVSLGNDAAARAVRLQRRRAWRDAGSSSSSKAAAGGAAGGDDASSVPCGDESPMDSWVCPRCEALLAGELPSLAASRCLLCSRVDGLLLRRSQEPKPSGSSRAPHPTDSVEGEVQWQGATMACSNNGNGSRCSYVFHVSCARVLGCRMEGHHGASHKVQCIFHSLQGPLRATGLPLKTGGSRPSDLRASSLRGGGGPVWQADLLHLLLANPIDYLQHYFVPGLLLTGLPHAKPFQIAFPAAAAAPPTATAAAAVAAAAPAAAAAGAPAAPAAAASAAGRRRSSAESVEEKSGGDTASGHASGPGQKGPGRPPSLPEVGSSEVLSDEETGSGSQTPAPPSPMHLAEQRELVQLSQVVYNETFRRRGEDSLMFSAMGMLWGPLEEGPLPAVAGGGEEDAAEGPYDLKRSLLSKEETADAAAASPRRQQKRRREADAAGDSSPTPLKTAAAAAGAAAATDAAAAAAALFGLPQTVHMPQPPPPKVAASAAMLSAQWYGGICCAALPPSEEAGQQPAEGPSPVAPGADPQGPAALPVGPPGQVEGETKPVFCPICNGLYKELPGGGPGDGLHWIGCDCCLQWYHWLCSGYTDDNPPPADEDWYCYFCATRIRASLEQKNKEKTQDKGAAAARQQPAKKLNA
ncbi:hypothetical protein Efla_007854 [Eimeria flavescens]